MSNSSEQPDFEQLYKDLLEDINLYLCQVEQLRQCKLSFNAAHKNKSMDAIVVQKRYEDYKDAALTLDRETKILRKKADDAAPLVGVIFTPF